jgi:hypothetical protein
MVRGGRREVAMVEEREGGGEREKYQMYLLVQVI